MGKHDGDKPIPGQVQRTDSHEEHNALESFGQGVAYSFAQAPYDGVKQLVNGASKFVSGRDIMPDVHIAARPEDTAGRVGEAVGMIPLVLGINKVVKAGFARAGLAAETVPLTNRYAIPIAEMGITGAIDQGIFMPSNDGEALVPSRLLNTLNGFTTFAAMSALGLGGKAIASPYVSAEALAARPIYARALNAGIYGGAGFGSGLTLAALERAEGRNSDFLGTATEYGALGAIFGGFGKFRPNTISAAAPEARPEAAEPAQFKNTEPADGTVRSAPEIVREVTKGERVTESKPTSGLAKLKSGTDGTSLYYKDMNQRGTVLDMVGEVNRPDPVVELQKADTARTTFGDLPEIADDYMRTAESFRTKGPAHFKDMMATVDKAIDIRAKVFEPNDPLLANTYNYAYNVSSGKVPPEVSAGYLEKAVQIWEANRPRSITDHYMNGRYKDLSRLYLTLGKPELAQEVQGKIKN